MNFHHVGVAVKDIFESAKHLGMVGDLHGVVCDPLQKVNVAFIGNDSELELVMPMADEESTPVTNLLAKGVSIYHICYTVDDIWESVNLMLNKGYNIISSPKSAVAFDGNLIAFVAHPADRILIELLEE